MIDLTSILITLLICLVLKHIWNRRKSVSQFKSHGIPGPAPSIWSGNQDEVSSMGVIAFLNHYSKKYGSVWGYYEGMKPVLVVSDVDMIKQITIKQFSNFPGRKKVPPMMKIGDSLFDMEELPEWKRHRAICASTFTALRMKEMSPLVNKSVDNIMELFEDRCKEGKAFNIHGDFQRMTIETIASCGFGIDTNSVKDPTSMFLQKCREAFHQAGKPTSLFPRLIFPFLRNMNLLDNPVVISLLKLIMPPSQITGWFKSVAKQVIESRKEDPTSNEGRVDFIKVMLDANRALKNKKENGHTEVNLTTEDTPHLDGTSEPKIRKGMTMQEMEGNTFLFLLAGYETTSSTLGFLSHQLAVNPEIQEKLQEEIDEHFTGEVCRPNYVEVQKLPYLDMFVNEVLRLYPIATTASTRHCNETCTIGGYTIPAGTTIQIDHEALHMNPDLWGPEDPKKCIPERFSPENKAMRPAEAWAPFGVGPRNCVGMRFALLEIKIALARVLKTYTIEKCAETEVNLATNTHSTKSPKNGVYVKLVRR